MSKRRITFEEKFAGHPYSWDYSTKCIFLLLHTMTAFREMGQINQRLLIRAVGLSLGTSEGPNMLRAVKISINRLFAIPFIVSGNGATRTYAIDWDNYDESGKLEEYFTSDIARDHYQYLINTIPY